MRLVSTGMTIDLFMNSIEIPPKLTSHLRCECNNAIEFRTRVRISSINQTAIACVVVLGASDRAGVPPILSLFLKAVAFPYESL